MRNGKILLIAILLFTASLGIGGTLAYLTDASDRVVNTFVPGLVPPSVEEDFDGCVKENVRIKNDGNISAYIRACVVITWKDAHGNLAPQQPVAGKDYAIEWTDSGWQKYKDYYYCLTPVEPGQQTPVLMNNVIEIEKKDGYDLVVEIAAQTIQADGVAENGKTPVELAWNVSIQNGNLQPAVGEEGTP